jgi:hypothetical protein
MRVICARPVKKHNHEQWSYALKNEENQTKQKRLSVIYKFVRLKALLLLEINY